MGGNWKNCIDQGVKEKAHRLDTAHGSYVITGLCHISQIQTKVACFLFGHFASNMLLGEKEVLISGRHLLNDASFCIFAPELEQTLIMPMSGW